MGDIFITGVMGVLVPEVISRLSRFAKETAVNSEAELYIHILEKDVPVTQTFTTPYRDLKGISIVFDKAYRVETGHEFVFEIRVWKENPAGMFSVYGISDDTPEPEGCAVNPGNIYAATKACQNMFGRIYAEAYRLLIRKGIAGEAYNIGSGSAVAIEDILNMILKQARADIKVEVDPSRFRPVDVPLIEPNIEKAQELTGWKPSIVLEETIRDTLDYWRNR